MNNANVINENGYNGYNNWETYIVAKKTNMDAVWEYYKEMNDLPEDAEVNKDLFAEYLEDSTCNSIWADFTEDSECSDIIRAFLEDSLYKVDFKEIVEKWINK